MGYRGFHTLSARKVLLMLILASAVLLLLHSMGNPAVRRHSGIKQNVFFEGKDMGGLSADEAAAVVSHLAGQRITDPVDAVIDAETNGVIPDVSGTAVDVEETVAVLLQAEPWTNVEPVYREIPAAVVLADFPELPVYRGNPLKPQVTFLINVAWGNEYLPEMLDVLKEQNAKATFFLVGRWVRENPQMAKEIADAGFEIANHGNSDALSMAAATEEQAAADIKGAADAIEEACGQRPIYFSPHKGELSERVLRAAAGESARVVMWTVDTVDWMLPGVDVMVNKILSRADGGSLILMHPTEQTADFLRQVIPGLRERGYEPVTLSTLLDPASAIKGVNLR